METFQLNSVSLFHCTVLVFFFSKASKKRLPPGPFRSQYSVTSFGCTLHCAIPDKLYKKTHARYGLIITLHIGSDIAIFISDHRLVHKMLIQNEAIFTNRPPPMSARIFFNNNDRNVNGSPYSLLWRLLRRNLMMETLHPSRAKLFSPARSWVLSILTNKLLTESRSGALSVEVMGCFQFAMFSLLVFMCFGERLDEQSIKAIGVAHRNLLVFSKKLNVLIFAPFITKFLYRGRLKTSLELQQKQKDVYVPSINERREYKTKNEERESRFIHSYVDTLFYFKIPEEGGRNLTEDEIVELCSEFLGAGSNTTSTTLQWIMAEFVKNQEIQKKLFDKIKKVIGENMEEEIKEEDLYKYPYLKAVVLEALRRHPPCSFYITTCRN
ncbi:hypothetical protein LUZ60_008913 [Juncus effusus]|nr:hypothetical protein LUZ60_008913 [Juncus effusus]